jgi:hypothetical protein
VTLTGGGPLIALRQCLPHCGTCYLQPRSELIASLSLVERRRKKRREFDITQLLERAGQILREYMQRISRGLDRRLR